MKDVKLEKNKIVIFGAGKIGRSFIGQLFGCNGYKIVLIDIDPRMITELNRRGRYRVVIKGDRESELMVPVYKAVNSTDIDQVVQEVISAGILAVSVGKNALPAVTDSIVKGLIQRHILYPEDPLDIILAENMRSAAEFVRIELEKRLPDNFPTDEYIGLIETSIGKMVPITPKSILENDPLTIFAEPYNTLILDRKGFKAGIPEISELAPKANIKAWVDRKAFIHNLGHATAAYFGFYLHPEFRYMYEILNEKRVVEFTKKVMRQSAEILIKLYPYEYTLSDLNEHIDELIHRFSNKELMDTVYRVGIDLTRKLGAEDRFMGAIHLAVELNLPFDAILEAMSFGLVFRAKNEEGKHFVSDIAFLNRLKKSFEHSIVKELCLDPKVDSIVIQYLKTRYQEFTKGLD